MSLRPVVFKFGGAAPVMHATQALWGIPPNLQKQGLLHICSPGMNFFDSYSEALHHTVPREAWSQMQATVNFTESRWEERAELRGNTSHPPTPPWRGFLEASGLPSRQSLPAEQPCRARLRQWLLCCHRAPRSERSNPSNPFGSLTHGFPP